MDKASDSGSEDCGFDSHRGYLLTFYSRQARGLEESIGTKFLRLRGAMSALDAALLLDIGDSRLSRQRSPESALCYVGGGESAGSGAVALRRRGPVALRRGARNSLPQPEPACAARPLTLSPLPPLRDSRRRATRRPSRPSAARCEPSPALRIASPARKLRADAPSLHRSRRLRSARRRPHSARRSRPPRRRTAAATTTTTRWRRRRRRRSSSSRW